MSKKMSRYPSDRKVYIGDLGNNARKNELEHIFNAYGPLRSVWVARSPPGFAFVEFEDARDAADAVRGLDGRTICGRRARVELSTGKSTRRVIGSGGNIIDRRRSYFAGVRGRFASNSNGGSEDKCYECGDRGHYARECRRHGRGKRRYSHSHSRSTSRDRNKSQSHSATNSYSRSRSMSGTREVRKSRDIYARSRDSVRENGETRYDDNDRNVRHSSTSPKRRYVDDKSPSPKFSKRSRADCSRRHSTVTDSSISRSRSASHRE